MAGVLVPRIGISGWRYKPWRGTFYPQDLAQKNELRYAATRLNSIEINGSFYSLQRPSSWQRWHAETPDDFLFSVKGARFITHMKKLKDVEGPLANFFAQGVLALKEKLGPILWQFPPNFIFRPEKIEPFFEMLPRDTEAAAALAARHEPRMKGRAFFKIDAKRPLRYAMEVRHETFLTPEFVALLRKHKVALVVADTAGKWPFMEDLTADFVYVRLHGDEKLYTSGYTPTALDRWAGKVNGWLAGGEAAGAVHASPVAAKARKGREVFVYFDNDVKVRAPFDAFGLAQRTGGFIPEDPPLHPPENMPGDARANWPALRPPQKG